MPDYFHDMGLPQMYVKQLTPVTPPTPAGYTRGPTGHLVKTIVIAPAPPPAYKPTSLTSVPVQAIGKRPVQTSPQPPPPPPRSPGSRIVSMVAVGPGLPTIAPPIFAPIPRPVPISRPVALPAIVNVRRAGPTFGYDPAREPIMPAIAPLQPVPIAQPINRTGVVTPIMYQPTVRTASPVIPAPNVQRLTLPEC